MFNRKKRRQYADLLRSLTRANEQATKELRAINKRLEGINAAVVSGMRRKP